MNEPVKILEQASPAGNLWALVERFDQVVVFYLFGGEQSPFGLKVCWVRNLGPAPADLDRAAMRDGRPPMLPAPYCRHPGGAPAPDPASLRVLWFEEGDSAALFENDEVLAVIPPWSGVEGCNGYARDCTTKNALCWPLDEAGALQERIRRAEAFWQSWDPDPWPQIHTALRAPLEAALGPAGSYYAIHGGNWPPRALGRFTPADGVAAFVTVGASIRPQPQVEMNVEDPENYRRIELGVAIDAALLGNGDDVPRLMSALSSLPWAQFSWIGPGHTVAGVPFPVGPMGTRFEAVLFLEDPPAAPPIALPSYRGDPVKLLWVVPITLAEQKLAQDAGSEVLVASLRLAGVTWTHRDRRPVA